MTIDELTQVWTTSGDINGEYRRYEQPEGFCKAACQYWISEMARWTSDREILKMLDANSATIRVRQDTLGASRARIPGLRSTTVLSRNSLGLGSFKSFDRVMDAVLERDGLYLLGARTAIYRSGAGHAVAFSRRNGEFRFFDPNAGTYSARGLTADRKRVIRAWFRQYWTEGYQHAYHHGPRELFSYDVESFAELLDLGADPFIYVLAAFL